MDKQVKILKALANIKRLEILKLLEKQENLFVTEIAQEIALHFKSTSKHLQKLVEAGLLSSTKHGFRLRHNLLAKTNKLLKSIEKL